MYKEWAFRVVVQYAKKHKRLIKKNSYQRKCSNAFKMLTESHYSTTKLEIASYPNLAAFECYWISEWRLRASVGH